ncbi:MAG TPA: flagellin [Bryobacteraceae bacterium]|nr:flagellin [Bryobacteraceae bacterium]
MISNLSGPAQIFLANVDRIQQNLAEANREVSSGLKIAAPSDDPDAIAPLLQLRADMARNNQVQANLVLAQTDATSSDNVLTTAIQLMNQAQTIATQATDVSLSASDRASLAGQIQSIQQQMVALSNTQVQGRYIFSGDGDQTEAYQINNGPDPLGNGVTQVSVSPATRQVQDPAGGSFAASLTAQEIFDVRNPDGSCATNNVFASLTGLRQAILGATSSDTSGIQSAAANLQAANAQLNTAQGFYGNVEVRIQDAQSYATTQNTQLQAQIGNIQDADVASAALQLSQDQTQLTAAFQAQAQMPTKTLFDYVSG